MIPPDTDATVREVVLPIDQYGRKIRIDHHKGRTPGDVMAILGRWLERWAKRKKKWLCNEAKLSWWRDLYTDELVVVLKWAAFDAPPGEPSGRQWAVPENQTTFTYRMLEQ